MQLRRWTALLELVVQHRTVLIERDDGVVGQLLLAQAAGLHELERDLELAGAGAEGAFGGDVPTAAEPVRFEQGGDLVRGLGRAPVVELRNAGAPGLMAAGPQARAPGRERR